MSVRSWYAASILIGFLACHAPAPAPTPTPTPIPTPSPIETPLACAPAPSLDLSPLQPEPVFRLAVRAAQEALGDVCGQDSSLSLDRLALQLCEAGYCANRDEDRVVIQREPPFGDLYEEHHAVYYGDGCWTFNTFKRVLKATKEK